MKLEQKPPGNPDCPMSLSGLRLAIKVEHMHGQVVGQGEAERAHRHQREQKHMVAVECLLDY